MLVTIQVSYEGDLRCRAVHGPSGVELMTDAPVDNHGRGEFFSPTDLVASALASCVLTIMGLVAERHGIDLTGTTATVEKHMVADPARRIGALPVTIRPGVPLTEQQRGLLSRAAQNCPVLNSLDPRIAKNIQFV